MTYLKLEIWNSYLDEIHLSSLKVEPDKEENILSSIEWIVNYKRSMNFGYYLPSNNLAA